MNTNAEVLRIRVADHQASLRAVVPARRRVRVRRIVRHLIAH